MTIAALLLVGAPIALFGYAYVGYPLVLSLLTRRSTGSAARSSESWPSVTVTVPVYNEERNLPATLDALLAQDYPADRRQILVISDASTDRTDAIALEYAARGVELLRLPQRGGKTAAENAADRAVRGEIVVNTDATVRLLPTSLKTLVAAFADPTVGVASGRDVSIGARGAESNQGEQGYVGYEMWVRRLETRLGSIVGASGCFYGTRRHLYDGGFPESLSRDFASALVARRRGYRAVSVEEAVCMIPRSSSLRSEFQRKIRTMARGLQTLWFMRELMNPSRHGRFAFALISHKLCRWLVSLLLPGAVVGLLMLAPTHITARLTLAALALSLLLAAVALRWPNQRLPSILSLPAFAVASSLAGVLAWIRALRGRANAVWEPTRRGAPAAATNRPA